MKSSQRVLLLVLLWFQVSGTQTFTQRFPIGERLDYSLWFNFIKGGSAVMEIVSLESLQEVTVYHLNLRSESSPFFDRIFKVRDNLHSWTDVQGLYSHRFHKEILEGGYRKRYTVHFDYQKGRAYAANDTVSIKGKLQDALSVIYRVRAEELQVGKVIRLKYFDNNRLRDFNVSVARLETIEVPAGRYSCYVLEPFSSDGKLFKYQADMTIYVTNDTLRLPVLITTNASFGKMVFKMESYRAGS